jgi:hypothetical protein
LLSLHPGNDLLKFKRINNRETPPNGGLYYMYYFLTIGILTGVVGLVAYEFINEIRNSRSKLSDRYHE